jgi:hypothetical protein
MSSNGGLCRPRAATQCRGRALPVLALAGALAALGLFPGAAAAHGPVAPIATSYLARVSGVPAGLDAKVVNGDQGMWLNARGLEVVVFDYKGAPYLRFSRSGVAVNHNSAMYYLNQNPAQAAPLSLTRATPPRWQRVTGADQYTWHDGRLHALATVALRPGASFVGRWNIPISVDGRRASISGGLSHADDPSLVWFWPIVVLLACALAVARMRRPALDVPISRLLALVALAGIATIAVGGELYGRPHVGVGQVIVLSLVLAFVAYGLIRLVIGRAGGFHLFVISFVALWAGGTVLEALLYGFVLMAVPAFVARTAVVLALGCGGALFLVLLARMDRSEDTPVSAESDVAPVAVR